MGGGCVMGRVFGELVSVWEARRRALGSVSLVFPGVEEAGLVDAVGRVSAATYRARVDSPPMDRSAVDGYAVRSADTLGASSTNPVVLRLVGRVEAGEEPRCVVEPGTCCEIYTGAEMPRGADAVVMYEDTGRRDGFVEIYRPVPRYGNVSRRGEDYSAGDIILGEKTVVRPWHAAALASQGYASIRVYRRLMAGVIVTGSELVEPGEPGGGIYNSTGYMVLGLLRETGVAEPRYHGIVGDDAEKLARVIEKSLREDDFAITTGGTSLGGRDVVPDAIDMLGGRWVFRGVALRPGKPTSLAIIGDKPVFILSGYPVAAWTGFKAVVEPVLHGLLGVEPMPEPSIEAVLTRRLPNPVGYTSYVRVRVEPCGGMICATPFSVKGSGLLSSLTSTNGYIVVPEGVEGYEKGEAVRVYLTNPAPGIRGE